MHFRIHLVRKRFFEFNKIHVKFYFLYNTYCTRWFIKNIIFPPSPQYFNKRSLKLQNLLCGTTFYTSITTIFSLRRCWSSNTTASGSLDIGAFCTASARHKSRYEVESVLRMRCVAVAWPPRVRYILGPLPTLTPRSVEVEQGWGSTLGK